jgi:hypothetical protein
MAAIKHTVEEITQLLLSIDGCDDGIQRAKDTGIYGMEFDEAIPKLRALGFKEDAAWLKVVKKTEQYVRFNGKEITMLEKYQVFNPLTGTHAEYENEAAARAAVLEITNQILENNKVTVVRAITNENGDSAWAAATLSEPIRVV